MQIETMPPRDFLLKILTYNQETGALTWRKRADRSDGWNTRWAGKPALAYIGVQGYLRGGLNGQFLYQHRVIFKMMTGLEPEQIDHWDGCRANNRWRNLSPATAQINARNAIMKQSNTSGRTGIYLNKRGKWVAQIRGRIDQPRHLGTFNEFNAACAAREAAEREIGFRARARS